MRSLHTHTHRRKLGPSAGDKCVKLRVQVTTATFRSWPALPRPPPTFLFVIVRLILCVFFFILNFGFLLYHSGICSSGEGTDRRRQYRHLHVCECRKDGGRGGQSMHVYFFLYVCVCWAGLLCIRVSFSSGRFQTQTQTDIVPRRLGFRAGCTNHHPLVQRG